MYKGNLGCKIKRDNLSAKTLPSWASLFHVQSIPWQPQSLWESPLWKWSLCAMSGCWEPVCLLQGCRGAVHVWNNQGNSPNPAAPGLPPHWGQNKVNTWSGAHCLSKLSTFTTFFFISWVSLLPFYQKELNLFCLMTTAPILYANKV